jgi:hypothetical protein
MLKAMLKSIMSKDDSFTVIPAGIALAEAIVATVRDPLLVLDEDLRIVSASRASIGLRQWAHGF